jgi:hypothetical protein|tara:strand:- start:262 stop:480 length:219 start_codon:yes stop_codon:yes gene_type:complete
MDEREVIYEEDQEDVSIPEDELLWSHDVLNQFEMLVDSLGIETVFFLLSREHEDIVNNWVKNKVDIQHRRKQ